MYIGTKVNFKRRNITVQTIAAKSNSSFFSVSKEKRWRKSVEGSDRIRSISGFFVELFYLNPFLLEKANVSSVNQESRE